MARRNFKVGTKYLVDGRELNELYAMADMKGVLDQIKIRTEADGKKSIGFANFYKVYILQGGAALPVFMPFWPAPEDEV